MSKYIHLLHVTHAKLLGFHSMLRRDKELAKVEVKPEDVDVIANQFMVRKTG